MYERIIVGIALAGISIAPLAARPVSGPKCFNCDNFGGDWECRTGSIWGGSSCTLTADSCTVSGNCNTAGTERTVSVGAGTILEIAASHPRVAASVFLLTRGGHAAKNASVFWSADAMSREQVARLLDGGTAGLAETPGESVIHDSYVETSDAGISLFVVPRNDFADDPVFTELRLELSPNADGDLVPTSFSIR